MSFTRTRSDGAEVEIVSMPASKDMTLADYYQWGKNNANLEHDEETTRKTLVSFGIVFSAEESDEFWRGYFDNQVKKEPA